MPEHQVRERNLLFFFPNALFRSYFVCLFIFFNTHTHSHTHTHTHTHTAVVANLWDVTDGDIDRYCEKILQVNFEISPFSKKKSVLLKEKPQILLNSIVRNKKGLP